MPDSIAAARVARPQHADRFHVGSMADMPFADRSFASVLCLRFSFNALPLLTTRVAAMAEMWRVLQPGGRLAIEVFNWNYAGRFGATFVANRLELVVRQLRWIGQGSKGSPRLPERDIIYLANKSGSAAPGYAHLTTAREMRSLAAKAGVGGVTITSEAALLQGEASPRGPRTWTSYSMWLTATKS